MAKQRTTRGEPVEEDPQPSAYPGPEPGESNARAVRSPAPGSPVTTDEPVVDETDPANRETPPETELDATTETAAPPRTRKAAVRTTTPKKPARPTAAVKRAETQRRRRVGKHRS